ncbi:MAG: FAD-dependent oxidoreductase [Calditrichaeota bacterium]|nr:FAD-dependent oxidoreductase [Calditrichota bacterium]
MREHLAVIGSGISGLGAAHVLGRVHQVELFEAAPRFGGHVHTHQIRQEGRELAVDSGFIVFNEHNYPLFTHLLQQLDVESRASTMSFSVKNERSGLEYNGSSPGQLFSQRRNLFSPAFHRMLRDIVRFNREARELARDKDQDLSLGEFLDRGGWSRTFRENYLLPMGSALWSADPRMLLEFPAQTFVRFFDHHRMLDLKGRPEWRTVQGGSDVYVRALLKQFTGRAHSSCPVAGIRRTDTGVELRFPEQPPRLFDQVILAVHSDQALRLLDDPSPREVELLSSIPYQANETVMHTDARILPSRRKAWGAWNSRIPREERGLATVSYLMNQLQGLPVSTPLLVSLNSTQDIDPASILARIDYEHPVYTAAAVAGRRLLPTLNGQRRTWYCGAWCGNGFHENGLRSAMDVCAGFGLSL